jgi:hypothetical protein
MEKIKIAKLLHNQPNVNASSIELMQFFRSPQYKPNEENEGNIIEDFLEFKNFLYIDEGDYVSKIIESWKNKKK